jgi:hypothetical protein
MIYSGPVEKSGIADRLFPIFRLRTTMENARSGVSPRPDPA